MPRPVRNILTRPQGRAADEPLIESVTTSTPSSTQKWPSAISPGSFSKRLRTVTNGYMNSIAREHAQLLLRVHLRARRELRHVGR